MVDVEEMDIADGNGGRTTTAVDREVALLLAGCRGFVFANGYVQITKNGQSLGYLHRLITGAPKGLDVDHKNGNKLDNRCANLRICTRSQNAVNKGVRKDSTSGVTGVIWLRRKQRWQASVGGKPVGTFLSKRSAIDARNIAVSQRYGDFAVLQAAE